MGSDGLFDNLYDEDILKCVYPNLKSQNLQNPNEVAVCLANNAEEKSLDKKYFSPFAKGAKQSGRYYMGGKHDDITVIVAQIKNRE